MKHSVPVKFIAILLSALTLVSAAACAAGIALMGQNGMYGSDLSGWKQAQQDRQMAQLAQHVLERYCAHSFSGLPEDILAENFPYGPEGDARYSRWYDVTRDSWQYMIVDATGTVVDENKWVSAEISQDYPLTCRYPQLAQSSQPEGYAFEDSQGNTLYASRQTSKEYTVWIYAARGFQQSYGSMPLQMVEQLFGLRYWAIALLSFCLLLFAACVTYLCCAAGKTDSNSPVIPRGLNRLPLDLYAAITAGSGFLLVWLAWSVLFNWYFRSDFSNLGALFLALGILLAAALVVIGFAYAATAQGKVGDGFWWRHSLLGRLTVLLTKLFRALSQALGQSSGASSMMWRCAALAIPLGLLPLVSLYFVCAGHSGWLLPLILSLAADTLILGYCAFAYATLLQGAKKMADGELTRKIPTRFLLGDFRNCAIQLNALADAATTAARKQIRSERMKTELITNVSHDIKTPLTSIINYVDLLQKADDPQAREQYLEVLGRQSGRMKKLIEDLMEMSRASSGNTPVEILRIDGVEAINQALGEFSDKLAAAELEAVFHQPEAPVYMLSDGRLTWRVLSNLLSNIVKYARPGTRVYIDLVKLEGQVMLSLKNIPREDLSAYADELTERFVRGDRSRNTEGSGLGLHIAKSLMELQGGQLQLLADGDLFKVTLLFPTE